LSISCNIGSGVNRLHYFVFASSLFGHWVEGTLAAMSLARTFRSTPGVGTCCRSAVSRTSFFDTVILISQSNWNQREDLIEREVFEKLSCGLYPC
jgi:hypothetical protein